MVRRKHVAEDEDSETPAGKQHPPTTETRRTPPRAAKAAAATSGSRKHSGEEEPPPEQENKEACAITAAILAEKETDIMVTTGDSYKLSHLLPTGDGRTVSARMSKQQHQQGWRFAR